MQILPVKERRKRILTLAIPIVSGMVSQNILNLVDTAMVGTLGNTALAAVGIGGFAALMAIAPLMGISTGVQANVSRKKGEGKMSETAIFLNGGLLLVIFAAPVISVSLYFLIPKYYYLLNNDPQVMEKGIPYLQIRILSIVFVGMNFAFRGFWNAIDLSRLYMITMVTMHIVNVILNYILIFGKLGLPALGVTGAALATLISLGVGSCVHFFLVLRYAQNFQFLRALPGKTIFYNLLRLSVPHSMQQLFFGAGYTVLYMIIGKIGTTELAAAHVLISLMLICILPAMGLGLAGATLTGQALGRKDAEDARQWGWDVAKVAVIFLAVLGIPFWAMPSMLLSAFISDPSTLHVSILPLQIVGFIMPFEGLGLVLMNCLLGAGDSLRVMTISIFSQWGIFLPLAYFVNPLFGYGLLGVWVLQAGYRGIQTGLFTAFWMRGRWISIKL
ncbi:MAG: MATE family efflux transporter [Planctomycetes bacterium]|nr:MATE family efflux transporter [Planctomycetota bacterium]